MISPQPPSRTDQSTKQRAALSRLRALLNDPGLLRASLIEMKRQCGNPSCRCAKAKRHWHLSWYLGQSQRGRPRMKYVPRHLLAEVRLWVQRYRQARELLDLVSDENWKKIVAQTKRKR